MFMTSESPTAPQQPYNSSLVKKHMSRIAAVQCIYASLMDATTPLPTLIALQLEQKGEDAWLPKTPDKKLLQGIVLGTSEMHKALNARLSESLGERWTGTRMPLVMRALLLCALYEALYTPALRPIIIIDQYVGVADVFLDDPDIGFVHGVLHELMHSLRPKDMPHAPETP
ncbi:MAG: hypothetical protein EAZ74_00690 [Alphaproteobacteria bacterium]|nr:MAG: hypothetical protein EAY76_01255 [Alphaproteobacteria bacterium]TAF15948.1 MAG: hypothetical protein EAZ74_00690 [Alphaproteobacteria bacterium]TAF41935.1 MAG: hypothetical protein EAZ66_00460 [Alphaproteobacteria bacterium]TAF76762.1 MAG: hypothetical protein EAZ52_03145 [Alphaproteobacteria bacterium]